MTFDNKTVWITGASSGIGEAMAYAFSKANATLILSARRQEALEKVKANCSNPDKVHILTVDLAKEDELPSKVEQALALSPRIDVLVNNGGISQRAKVLDTEMEVYHKLMQVNFFGTVALSKALLPHFVKNGSGQFVVTSSLMGKFAAPFRSGYAAAKHALHGFFDGLRSEYYDNGVRVTMVCPGFVSTDISKNSLSGDGAKHGAMDEKTEQGITAEQCAQKIVKATYRQKEEVYIGRSEILAVYLKRFFPSILSRVVRKAKMK